ncbi:hypothetical protein [Anaerotignum sp.]|uniref:hypothetical protein n=1 Tax=Anaerotignum sp. TaxID=2039241 RepID=UPI00271473DE|nr:hypothetical protein [Anaerotignum sp.]
MSYIEENAYEAMQNIFSTISNEEKCFFEGYFAADMVKVNKKDCVYPCFFGFNSTSITIVKINLELEKENANFIPTSRIKDIRIKKMFLSKSFHLIIECDDNSSFTLAVPYTLKYIYMQSENVEKFLKRYQDH